MTPLLTVAQVAELLSASESFVYRLVSEGKLRGYRLGRAAIRFSQTQIEEYLSSCEVKGETMPSSPRSLKLKHLV